MAEQTSKLIQHIGIVAGICKEVKLIEEIDKQIPKEKRSVSVGQAVQAMILNALGLSGRALYLTKRYYVNRPVEKLIGERVSAEQLNDASLGTALDAIYEYGITELFFNVSSQILKRQGIETKFAHLDSTTFSLHGEYNSDLGEDELIEGVIQITRGYSKDNNPQLNQVVAQLISANKSSIPLWIEALSGNSNDKKSFRKTVKQFQKQFNKESMPYIVMDAAFYSKENIIACSDIKWVTRVPEILKEVKELYQRVELEEFTESKQKGYAYYSISNDYGGIKQRWLIVYSGKSYERQIKTFEKDLKKNIEKNAIALKHLRNKAFACEEDAVKDGMRFNKKLKYQVLNYQIIRKDRYGKKGRPVKDQEIVESEWFIEGTLQDDLERIERDRKKKGLFIIATNEMDTDVLSEEQLLEVYKDQGVSVERGFRFLKDPVFYAESLYLKKPERIMALIMVMTLSLLMYSLAERKIRASLAEKNIWIWDQKNKPTYKPTIRWIFMIFEDVLLHYESRGGPAKPMNIREEHIRVLNALGPIYEKIYFL